MLKQNLLSVFTLSVAYVAAAGPEVAQEDVYRVLNHGKVTTLVRGPDLNGAPLAPMPPVAINPDNPQAMLAQFGSLLPNAGALHPEDSLELISLREDSSGVTRAAYRQLRRGIPVLNAHLRVSTVPAHVQVGLLHFGLYQGSDFSMHKQTNPDLLIQNFFNGATVHGYTPPEPVLFWSEQLLVPGWSTVVNWTAPDGIQRWHDVVLKDSDGTTLSFTSALRRGLNRRVIDGYDAGAVRQDHASGVSDPPTGDLDVDTLFDHLFTIHETALGRYEYDFINSNGGPLLAHANCTLTPDQPGNAFFIPKSNTALYPEQLCFGPGTPSEWLLPAQIGPLAHDLDVVAHEYTHALLRKTTGLRGVTAYDRAIEEGIADLFAVAVSLDHGISRPWAIAEQSWTPEWSGDALRYVDDPTASPSGPGHDHNYIPGSPDVPYTGLSCARGAGSSPNAGNREKKDFEEVKLAGADGTDCIEHAGGAIVSYAAYLLGNGGFHKRFPSLWVNSIGWQPAVDLFIRAALEFSPSQDLDDRLGGFRDFKEKTVELAEEKYGLDSPELISVCKAWHAVGVPAALHGYRVYPCDLTIPDAPHGVHVVSTGNGINTISWSPPDFLPVTEYRVFAAMSAAAEGTLVWQGTDTHFEHTFVGPDQYIRVQACGQHSCGELSGSKVAQGGAGSSGGGGIFEREPVTP